MYIAMNRFRVTAGRGDVFEAAWRDRNSYLDRVPGFVSFRLLKGADGVYVSHSTWTDLAAFDAWTESDAFVKAHRQRLPEGVLAGPPELSCYEVVLAQDGGAAGGGG